MEKTLLLICTIFLFFACKTNCEHHTFYSQFRRCDSLQVREIFSPATGVEFGTVGHHGPAVENKYMALRFYFDGRGAIDVYNKSGRIENELGRWKWYPPLQAQLAEGAGCDEYYVGNTVGLGGVRLWDGEKEVYLNATGGRRSIVGGTEDGAFMEMISYAIPYQGDTVDVSVRVNVMDNDRWATVTVRELNDKPIRITTGVNYHPGSLVRWSNGWAAVWGKHPADVSSHPISIGGAIRFDELLFPEIEETGTTIRLISTPQSYFTTSIMAASVKESELNTSELFFASVPLIVSRPKIRTTIVKPLAGECWWGAVANKGYVQPYVDFSAHDNYFLDDPLPDLKSEDDRFFELGTMSAKGVTAPLLVSNKGRYIWSDRPFGFKFSDGVLILSSRYEKIEPVTAGETLREAYLAACRDHFPFAGREPAELMFTKPQFNNWIETVVLGINQDNAEKFVDALHASGFPCGVVMIDGGWQRYHGCRDFNPDIFPEAKRLFDKIHDYGYKGVLWISYFLSADSRPEYVSYKPGAQDILVRSKTNPKDAALVWWWNGISATMDITRGDIRKKLTDELQAFAERFHIDGFKFDGGDPEYFRDNALFSEPWMEPADFGQAYARVGEAFPYNEYRAAYNFGGKPIVVRHYDVGHNWTDFKAILPDMLTAGLLGCPYVFADMIGGGHADSYKPGNTFSHKLFIRSCELQALMPMMQFSAAPWRVLTEDECAICRKFAELHVEFGPYIMEQVHHASSTGEPIMRSMEYEFPGCGYEHLNQQFMLGSRYLVAPVTDEDDTKTVYLPAGRWKDDRGEVWLGPRALELENVPLDRLPYYECLCN